MRQQITKLAFDHCNHNEINILLYCEVNGKIPYIQIVTGSGLSKIDSSIISIAKHYSEFFSPVSLEDSLNKYLIYIKYKFHNRSLEEMLSKSNGSIDVAVFANQINSQVKRAENNECEDNSYFYKEGLKYFQLSEFNKAIVNFSLAIKANPSDMDANYNLGISYQKIDKLKKACECFSKGADVGDVNSMEALLNYCSEVPVNK